mmetsp:Transcript_29954/g.63551  ORF Transcript_29954/g.63551 Transcript_29954/m.63551 type:complete len:283 (+) Transcript_29954:507-1355(+)
MDHAGAEADYDVLEQRGGVERVDYAVVEPDRVQAGDRVAAQYLALDSVEASQAYVAIGLDGHARAHGHRVVRPRPAGHGGRRGRRDAARHEQVVLVPPLRVLERLVRVGDDLERVRQVGRAVPVLVGMQLQRQLPVRLLDVGLGGRRVDAEDAVVGVLAPFLVRAGVQHPSDQLRRLLLLPPELPLPRLRFLDRLPFPFQFGRGFFRVPSELRLRGIDLPSHPLRLGGVLRPLGLRGGGGLLSLRFRFGSGLRELRPDLPLGLRGLGKLEFCPLLRLLASIC